MMDFQANRQGWGGRGRGPAIWPSAHLFHHESGPLRFLLGHLFGFHGFRELLPEGQMRLRGVGRLHELRRAAVHSLEAWAMHDVIVTLGKATSSGEQHWCRAFKGAWSSRRTFSTQHLPKGDMGARDPWPAPSQDPLMPYAEIRGRPAGNGAPRAGDTASSQGPGAKAPLMN